MYWNRGDGSSLSSTYLPGQGRRIWRHPNSQSVIPAQAGIHCPRKNLGSRPRFHEGRLFAGVTDRQFEPICAYPAARVCVETGERFFAPDIVERLHHIVWEQRKPTRVVETPVFEFA